MSLFDDDRYNWRETYFVFFDPARRPRLENVRQGLLTHTGTFKILDDAATPDGLLASLTVASYEDHSALEVSYKEGNDVHIEIGLLAETIERACTAKEKEQLREARKYRAKFEILHFEQTAGTEAFEAVKLPDLKFKKQSAFSKQGSSDKLTYRQKERFRFDPNSFENCITGGAGANFDWDGTNTSEDSSIIERLDPNTLIIVLEILSRASRGIAIDPASGIVI